MANTAFEYFLSHTLTYNLSCFSKTFSHDSQPNRTQYSQAHSVSAEHASLIEIAR